MEIELAESSREQELKELAVKNFAVWNEALQTKDPAAVAELYTENASFLPTLNPDFKHGRDGAEQYFEHFLEKDPEGEIIDEQIQPIGEDCYIHSGMYNFEVGPKDDRKIVEARFTFVWQKNERDEWKIVHHHSSLVPNK
ncbi:MAG: SgcJ/EcaC family oxidoreductase [Candidatus Buchananbacteria bacterium]|nr:SgcJ/EcaC family oxidoreductase [Candidatus Buchananbacteria bacterium]